MRILLINPPIPRKIRMLDFAGEQVKKSFGRRVMVGPPLALNELAGMVPEEEIMILDQKTENDQIPNYSFLERVECVLDEFRPDYVGITCITAQYNSVMRILRLIRRKYPQILVSVGGMHPTLCPEMFAGSGADLLALGIGKYSFRQIVEEYRQNGKNADFTGIPGLAIDHDGRLEYTAPICSFSFQEIKERFILDEVLPNRKLTDHYNYTIRQMNKKIHYISTSQGCTHKCNFCSIWPMTAGRYFNKKIETILAELKTMDQYPIIRLCDANTFGNPKEARELFSRIIEDGLNQHFYMADVRTDFVVSHPDIMELAVKAGLQIVVCGLEATSDEELEAYNKSNTVESISEGLKILNELGIFVNGNYIVKPDYTEPDFERLGRFVEENPIYHSGFTVLTPFPGTPLYEDMKHDIINHDLDYYNLTNAVTRTVLSEENFYENVGNLYKVSKSSTDTYLQKYDTHLLAE